MLSHFINTDQNNVLHKLLPQPNCLIWHCLRMNLSADLEALDWLRQLLSYWWQSERLDTIKFTLSWKRWIKGDIYILKHRKKKYIFSLPCLVMTAIKCTHWNKNMSPDKCFCAYAPKRKQFWQGIENIWGIVSAFENKATLKKNHQMELWLQ